jgi:SAM-dependent methyltransferase
MTFGTKLLSNIICFVLGWLTCVAHEQLYEQFENLGSTAEDDFIDVRHLQALKAEPFRGLAATEECRGALDALLGISPAVAQTIHAEIDRYSGDHQNRAVWAGTELSRHYKSKTFLQDAFVRLHNFLFAAKLLPLVEWGKGRGIDISSRSALAPWLLNATKVGRGTGYAGYHAGPSVISRLAINAYVLAERAHIAPGSVCLGWDSTEFVDLVPGCVREQSWALVFKNGKVKVDVAQRKLHADIASLVDASAVSSVPRFDLIICQEVFEHVRRPADGAKGLYNLLRSGGRVLFTVPFNSHFHLIPTDFFRYSLDGARSLLADAGLTIERTYKIGNSAIASGFMLGFGAGDFNFELMEHKLLQPVTEPVGSSQRWGRLPEALYVGTCVTARRPQS